MGVDQKVSYSHRDWYRKRGHLMRTARNAQRSVLYVTRKCIAATSAYGLVRNQSAALQWNRFVV